MQCRQLCVAIEQFTVVKRCEMAPMLSRKIEDIPSQVRMTGTRKPLNMGVEKTFTFVSSEMLRTSRRRGSI